MEKRRPHIVEYRGIARWSYDQIAERMTGRYISIVDRLLLIRSGDRDKDSNRWEWKVMELPTSGIDGIHSERVTLFNDYMDCMCRAVASTEMKGQGRRCCTLHLIVNREAISATVWLPISADVHDILSSSDDAERIANDYWLK